MARFAEVILPLPLYSTFTYLVPEELEPLISTGSRVFVQFGRKKYYTGIVESVHARKPQGYEVKPIMMLLDEYPVVRYPQLKFWNWIAEYYLCSIGEVYKAAVPSGLKIESETYIAINQDYESADGRKLSDKEAMIVMALEQGRRMRVADIEEAAGLHNIGKTVSTMLQEGILEIDERIVDKYKPVKETYVRLKINRDDDEGLREAMNALNRSRQGEKALICYLDKSRWLVHGEDLREVTRKEITEATGATPGVIRTLISKGIFELYTKELNRFSRDISNHTHPLPPLSEAQDRAHREVLSLFKEKPVVLFNGVTGSGKTEIYCHLIQAALEHGDQVLYLVPEISLTTQLTDRLRKVFGNRMLVYHSKFSDSERVDIYKRLLSSMEPVLVLGVRSSVFLPFARLGLAIVDEEHEASYKQYDPAPRYNARDAAIVLAMMHGAKTLLGSATPSIETNYKAITGKYGLVRLTERFGGAVLPDVEIVDMRQQRKRKLARGIISEPLRSATYASLRSKHQAIMFQNRRGFAPMVVCSECGWTPKCNSCDVSMVYHKNPPRLTCHYCGYTTDLPAVCPACGQNTIDTFGYGTERIAEEMHEAFDGFRVARMDLDTTRNKNSYQEIIEKFANHQTDILVGTQMVSKGLDFANVDLVGVLNADTLLNFPDFRSDERAFNMLEQVAGRAGRRGDKGRVIVQTTSPDSEVLRYVKSHDYDGFYAHEIRQREQYAYPPFTRVIVLYLKNKDRDIVDHLAQDYARSLKGVFGNRVLGPQRPTVGRISTYYLQTIMLKVEANASMRKVKNLLRGVFEKMASDRRMRSTTLYYDVDPV